MATPLHNLEDRLLKLRSSKSKFETEIKNYKKMLDEVNADILKFENAINLIKKGE